MHISKEGDPYLRTLLVQGAQHILGPFGPDCDLRRWGLKLAEQRRTKRQEASHRCDCEKAGSVAASPVGEWRSVRAIAQQLSSCSYSSRIKTKPFPRKRKDKRQKTKDKSPSRVPVTASNAWPRFHSSKNGTAGR